MRPETDDDDPLAQLAEWGRGAERRARRAYRLKALGRTVRRSAGAARRVVIFAVVLAILGTCGVLTWRKVIAAPRGPRPYATAATPDGISATTGAGDSLASPFDGTPAALFPAGQAGIVLPSPTATGPWTAADVRTALDRVRTALIVSHLDQRILVQHDAAPFALLAADSRTWWTKTLKGTDYGVTVVRIATDAKLAPVEPRVSGRLTYRAAKLNGHQALEVITNYVWVYAFDVPSGWTGSRTTVVHGEEHWFFIRSKNALLMYLQDTDGYWSSMDCASAKQGLTAPWRGGPAEAKPTSTPFDEPTEAYYQPDHSLDIAESC
ncbi:MAG: hypothetical protein HOU81_00115 [Hamadaea sp.]|uniref:hypothetical protein n=1 Tax=Hamadaea sp. TaxID=2024425 RepID=UPI001837EBE3|nr:hypothetical protein [Hamadaea sp.]NUR69221.1 hypothetical protein [Hamadaea sp.]NUT22303.1 hypothetical protein [Hamadaea sp.]